MTTRIVRFEFAPSSDTHLPLGVEVWSTDMQSTPPIRWRWKWFATKTLARYALVEAIADNLLIPWARTESHLLDLQVVVVDNTQEPTE